MKERMYIHQHKNWTDFTWDNKMIDPVLKRVSDLQKKLIGRVENLGLPIREETKLAAVTEDVLKSSEIEGELLNPDQVRSSVARKLGVHICEMVDSPRNIDAIVEMMVDATCNCDKPLSEERLFGWHAALFPTGYSNITKIEVGKYRTGPMQVLSGPMGKEKVHFEGPEAEKVEKEMETFLSWFNNKSSLDPILKAAIAHLCFVTIHPFDDGNGRITRAITDMQLARSDKSPERFYSMSNQILNEKNGYYDILEKTQKRGKDITAWLEWFLLCLEKAILNSNQTVDNVLFKAAFWEKHTNTPLNERQKKVLNKLLDGFEGYINSGKWARMTAVSTDTALKDIKDLVNKGILKEATSKRTYELVKN